MKVPDIADLHVPFHFMRIHHRASFARKLRRAMDTETRRRFRLEVARIRPSRLARIRAMSGRGVAEEIIPRSSLSKEQPWHESRAGSTRAAEVVVGSARDSWHLGFRLPSSPCLSDSVVSPVLWLRLHRAGPSQFILFLYPCGQQPLFGQEEDEEEDLSDRLKKSSFNLAFTAVPPSPKTGVFGVIGGSGVSRRSPELGERAKADSTPTSTEDQNQN